MCQFLNIFYKKTLSFAFILALCLFLIIILPNNSSATSKLPEETLRFYSKNNILYYNPLGSIDCGPGSGGANYSGDGFRVDSSVNPWYKEGNYICTEGPGAIAHACYRENPTGTAYLKKGDPAWSEIHTDDSLGGLQYIYGEQWTRQDNWPYKLVKNSSTSQTKYYLLVLPNDVYGNPISFYVATFEKLPEPIYFITVDAHNSIHQDITNEAKNNPNYALGKGVLGYFNSYKAISDNALYQITGGITSFHLLSAPSANNPPILKETSSGTSPSPTPASSPASPSTDDCFHSSSEPFVRWDQTDPKYSSVNYDSSAKGGMSSSVFDSGCGPFSFAMLANALGVQNIDPIEVTKVAGDGGMHTGGSSHEITKYLADHYSMTYEKVDTGHSDSTYGNNLSDDQIDKVVETINSYLKKGWMIHTSGTSPMDNDCKTYCGKPFTPGGHYIGIRGITSDGKWLLADSNGPVGSTEKSDTKGGVAFTYTRRGDKNSTEEWDPKTVIKGGMNVGNVHAIRASDSATCGNFTTSDPCGNITSVSGGLSASDAQKLVNHYKTADMSGYSISGSRWNCVSLSYYFLQKITTIGKFSTSQLDKGLFGNGNRVATQIANAFSLPLDNTVKPYSIFSTTTGTGRGNDSYQGPNSKQGHTGLVIAVDGNNVTFIEADYYKPGYAGVKTWDISKFTNEYYPNGVFVHLDSVIDQSALQSILNGGN